MNLPEVFDVARNVTDVVNVDRGNIFPSFPKIAFIRANAQKEIYSIYLEMLKEFSMKKMDTMKDMEVIQAELLKFIEQIRIDGRCRELEIKLNGLKYFCEKGFLTPEMLQNFLSKLM